MKKLLMGSVVLTLFSTSMLLFQMSCKKDANAQTTTTGLTQLNKIAYVVREANTPQYTIVIANYDGTNKNKINIDLSQIVSNTGSVIGIRDVRLSPNGLTMFILTSSFATPYDDAIYSASAVDGSNFKLIESGRVNGSVVLGGAY